MTIHVYKCSHCGEQFEIKTDYNPHDELACPKCYQKAKRVFSPPFIRAKWKHGDIGSADNWKRYEE